MRNFSKPQPKQRRWAVLSDHYVNFDLSRSEAVAEAKDLRRRGQRGAAVVTNKTAERALRFNNSSRLAFATA